MLKKFRHQKIPPRLTQKPNPTKNYCYLNNYGEAYLRANLPEYLPWLLLEATASDFC